MSSISRLLQYPSKYSKNSPKKDASLASISPAIKPPRPSKHYSRRKGYRWQFVEPSNHRVNTAERAIQTHKNHFTSGLCSTDVDWPLQLWDQMTLQSVITMNIIRTSRIDPSKSAHHQLHVHKYDWNVHPMDPSGSKAVIYKSPESRVSWGTRGIDAWYCVPRLGHYRNNQFYVPATRAYRTSGSFELYPQHCLLPQFTPDEHANEVHGELIKSTMNESTSQKHTTSQNGEGITHHLKGIHRSPSSEGGSYSQFRGWRSNPRVTTSNNPTNPRTLRSNPRTHHHQTRRNTPTPGATPPSTTRSIQ